MAYHGILNIDKPAGWTSHDVVGKVRRLLGQKSVGHAGTLDPLATGVLLVCVGQATRVSEYLMAGRKVYRAVVQLGIETDTYDVEGTIVAQADVPDLTHEDLVAAIARFTGTIEQIPPAYSAIKQDGVPAYRKARRGEMVTIQPRQVTIHDIELLGWSTPYVTFNVTCDPGTYIRSLAHDLGASLGCGAVLAELRRLQSGQFRVEDAIGVETLEEAVRQGKLAGCIHGLDAALRDLTPVAVDADAASRLARGQAIPCVTKPGQVEGFAMTSDGAVIAILMHNAATGQWQPKKVFLADSTF
jgi:tRNA pseudouridine55 synthase